MERNSFPTPSNIGEMFTWFVGFQDLMSLQCIAGQLTQQLDGQYMASVLPDVCSTVQAMKCNSLHKYKRSRRLYSQLCQLTCNTL